MKIKNILTALSVVLGAVFASTAAAQMGPKGATVLIIRHAEKPETGAGLSPEGQARAQAYVRYFQALTIDSKPLTVDAIFAGKDSKQSQRPRLTVEPFAKAAKLNIDLHFKTNQSVQLVAALRNSQPGRRILISWRHGDIPDLLRALGANPDDVLPHGKWPDRVFDWIIPLRYDQGARLIPGSVKRISEHLMPGDSP